MYDPVIALFVSADSVDQDWYDPQSLNRYAYCRNNPLKYVDPDGHNAALAELSALTIGTALVITYGIYHYGKDAMADAGKRLGQMIFHKAESEDTSGGEKGGSSEETSGSTAPGDPDNQDPKKVKAKDRRLRDRARTEADKKAGRNTGNMDEAHRQQKQGSTQDLIQKEQDIKRNYPDQPARKTGQRIKDAMKHDAE